MLNLVFVSILSLFVIVKSNEFSGFDDSILHIIKWPGTENIDLDKQQQEEQEEIFLTTHRNEKYRCTIPIITDKDEERKLDTDLQIPSPVELLIPLFLTNSCSYRIESYWTYEVCHGRYIKQFHEEREGKTIKAQDYMLGKWNQTLTEKLLDEYKNIEKEHEKVQFTKVEGVKLPTLSVNMVDGTLCDLNGTPRTTRVMYVCDVQGKNEVYSLKETMTCSYEIIILTPLLCSHPLYKPEKQTENPISCYPAGHAATKPRSLLAMEAESLKTKYQKIGDMQKSSRDHKTYAVFKVDPKDGVLKMEFFEGGLLDEQIKDAISLEQALTGKEVKPKLSAYDLPTDKQPVIDFLEGRTCLNGGSGWWKYELCYGRYVRQYHIDKNGETSLILGAFNRDAHIDWLTKNPHKRPAPKETRTEIVHFYTGGTHCEKTGKPRQTEVKLKCLEKAVSQSSVSLYLLEPRTCEYELSVQSSLICDILHLADENGLVPSMFDKFTATDDDDLSNNNEIDLGN
ncbi:endoplasmic reticulum lectin 1 isoform X2 [Culicoides brevitarsis]|uniref:endoplasmic reticulum lectin 1 isoform X2 n=1 Tax=Culicoides brevitarsis TaxID=469753 RepID=UPI00307C2561